VPGDGVVAGHDRLVWALLFGLIVPVTWLGWRLGSRLTSPARESGRLL
jgi:hypothetical protein